MTEKHCLMKWTLVKSANKMKKEKETNKKKIKFKILNLVYKFEKLI